jgi:hypothetical protein
LKTATGTVEDLNLNLCALRNIGIQIAHQEKVGFADVFWPMLTAGVAAQQQFGTNYAIAGKDGVHPAWAGHTVMAYAFLKALGINGDIGTFTLDLKKGGIKLTRGTSCFRQRITCSRFKVRAIRFVPALRTRILANSYPSCAKEDSTSDNSLLSVMKLIPFNEQLNRLTLIGKNGRIRSMRSPGGRKLKHFSADNCPGE